MNIKTLTACGLLALASTTTQADTNLPQMNMDSQMITKEVEASQLSVGQIPIILAFLLILVAASASGSGYGYET